MAAFPPAPTDTIDWKNVGFQVREVNGHVECHYSIERGTWTEPEFIRSPFLQIHGMAPGLNYGQQCFEGMKAFRCKDNSISIFRPWQNAKRMAHSASIVSIPPVPESLFLRACDIAVGLNADFVPPFETGSAMYVRPLVFGSSAQLGLNPPDGYTFCVFVMPTGVYHGAKPVDALILEHFDRAAPEGTGSAKLGGNYAPVLKWSDKARADGYGITLHLDSKTRTEIDEFSTAAFIGLTQDPSTGTVTLTKPESRSAIKSVTQDSTCDIATDVLGWKLERRSVKYEDLSSFTEVFAAGTAAALVPIRSITLQSKKDVITYREGSHEVSPLFTELITTLQGIQRGIQPDKLGWLFKVRDPRESYPSGVENEKASANGKIGSVDALA